MTRFAEGGFVKTGCTKEGRAVAVIAALFVGALFLLEAANAEVIAPKRLAQVIAPVSPNPPGMAQPMPLPQGQPAPLPGSAMPPARPPAPRFSSPMCQLPTASQSQDLRAYCSAIGQ